ncbi:hypothetical protein RB13114 [Rhodopirellula baltica SH 1]|uniref:Uncharacterized protein n=1 Tax=Rhodopirellula baltica (strain DSM 10527 / NCIMB 13988 / SH1) TaxID=243090 RepID=Q7UHM0_RHOBA|nr:hypothetical protein RB13114 [Rhodopirellula baltica SH 1]
MRLSNGSSNSADQETVPQSVVCHFHGRPSVAPLENPRSIFCRKLLADGTTCSLSCRNRADRLPLR